MLLDKHHPAQPGTNLGGKIRSLLVPQFVVATHKRSYDLRARLTSFCKLKAYCIITTKLPAYRQAEGALESYPWFVTFETIKFQS